LLFLAVIRHYTSYHFITVRNHNGGKPFKLHGFSLAKSQTSSEMTRFWNHRVEKEKVKYLKAFRTSFLWKPKKKYFPTNHAEMALSFKKKYEKSKLWKIEKLMKRLINMSSIFKRDHTTSSRKAEPAKRNQTSTKQFQEFVHKIFQQSHHYFADVIFAYFFLFSLEWNKHDDISFIKSCFQKTVGNPIP
jgi:hypothetical protein